MNGSRKKMFLIQRQINHGLPDKNPYSSNKLKWDINDVIKWCRDNNYKQTIYWSKYFSNDMLDGLDI